MSALLCCLRGRRQDMGAALSHHQEGVEGVGVGVGAPTMADVIRERKKKAGGAVGTLRRRLANVARPRRDHRPDRGCADARFIRGVVSRWRLADVFQLCEELDALAALRDLTTRAELAREPAPALQQALPLLLAHQWWCDVQVVGAGWSLGAHRAILAARSHYFRERLRALPPGCARVVLDGAAAGLSRGEARAALLALYGAHDSCLCNNKYDAVDKLDGDLELNNEGNNCRCVSSGRAVCRSALSALHDSLHNDMRRLMDSGELCDCRLVFRLAEGGAAYGFRAALELPAHRAVLAARSRVLRSVLSRSGSNGAVCVDEAVLPRRFARALLHAAYTDQVELSLIGRSSSSPSSTSGAAPNSSWSLGRAGRSPPAAMLDDAFQLYEIARFLEMPIVVQGCEDAISEALSPETLPHVLRWAAAPHASQWVHRQAMRYLRDEWAAVSHHAALGALPLAALAAALASPFVQAGEVAVLRGCARWAAEQRGGARGRRPAHDAALGAALQPLLPLIRLEHVPADNDLLLQLVRRGLPPPADPLSADACLGRGSARPLRCVQAYLDELRALLRDQAPPERPARRLVSRIPDTLYMVSGRRSPAPAPEPLPARLAAALRARARELAAAPPAQLAAHHDHHKAEVQRQLALRAVRERSLPDSCAELLLQDPTPDQNDEEWDSTRSAERDESDHCAAEECCDHRSLNDSGSRCSGGSLRAPPAAAAAARRDAHHRSWSRECGRLSAAVPDVAMAPNANTHLLTHRDYFRHPPPWEYGGVVLQLDLGDGATHTPRPGSRAQRNSGVVTTRQRDYAQALAPARRARAPGPPAARNNTLPHYRDRDAEAHSSRHPEPPAPAHLPRGSVCGSGSPRRRLYPPDCRLERHDNNYA